MANYIVTITLDVEADSPIEAAEQLWSTLTDYPSSRVFNVREYGTEHSERVDTGHISQKVEDSGN